VRNAIAAAITNTNGVIALKLTCLGVPGENTIVRRAAPLSQGRQTCRDFRILGTCPAPVPCFAAGR
jgi:hypothetical protein